LTIVAGPNGIGKTTLLGLTHAFLSGDFRSLFKYQFETLSVTSDRGVALSVTPEPAPQDQEDEPTPLAVWLRRVPVRSQPTEAKVLIPRPLELNLPPYVESVGPDLFIDQRTRDVLSLEEVERRFSRTRLRSRRGLINYPEWFRTDEFPTDFIETKRLDSLLMRSRASHRREATRAPIHYYLGSVRAEMERVRSESSRSAQRRDRTFARRLLDKGSRLTVKPEELRSRYSAIEARATELASNGLLDDSLDMLPGGKLNPTEKRIISLFLDDFAAKMAPLEPVSMKLNQLKSIVDPKFLNKRLEFDAHQGATFLTEPDGAEIDADALSSGEQHELALMSRLLFSVESGTTVLIDEPELSLHVSWQHRMLDDLAAIAQLAELSFVLATHSTALINGRWELVEELGPIDDEPHG
jgi:AAA domain, putative AbiEii toxin, Type IV TA system